MTLQEDMDEAVDRINKGDYTFCGRPAIYEAQLGITTTFVCGEHSAWFADGELRLYDGDETCMQVNT